MSIIQKISRTFLKTFSKISSSVHSKFKNNNMVSITYITGCNYCMNADSTKSFMLWENKKELYIENRLISAKKMEILLQQYYRVTDKKCPFCGKKNQFSFFQIEIDDQPLLSEDAQYQVQTKTNKIVYKLHDLLAIIKSSENRFDLGCKKYSSSLNLHKDFSYMVSISMLLDILSGYYEERLLNYNDTDYILKHFNFFLAKSIDKDTVEELNQQIERLLLSNSNIFKQKDYPSLFITYELNEIFNGMDHSLCSEGFLKYFIGEYIKTHNFIVASLNSLLLPMGAKIEKGTPDYYRLKFSDFI